MRWIWSGFGTNDSDADRGGAQAVLAVGIDVKKGRPSYVKGDLNQLGQQLRR